MKRKIFGKHGIALLLSVVLVCVCLSVPDAGAYTYLVCDGDDKYTWTEECPGCAYMAVNPISFPVNSTNSAELAAAMQAWNNVGGSFFEFHPTIDLYSNTVSLGNDVNEVYLGDIEDPDAVAVTSLLYDACLPFDDADINEADVVFNENEDWWNGQWFYNLEDENHHPNLRMVALHEFGHVLGLRHENDVMATMNTTYPCGGPIGPNKLIAPLADDRRGVSFLYPDIYDQNVKPDLVGSNYKRIAPGKSDRVNSPTSVAAGSQTSFEFTFMNIGRTNSGSFAIGFYLSTDTNITTSDILLGTNTGASAVAGGLVTGARTVTIPSSVAPGFYWMGVLLDKNGNVAEQSESNNGLILPRLVVVTG
jgi:hypothetical protein